MSDERPTLLDLQPRLCMLAVLLVPGLGLAACGHCMLGVGLFAAAMLGAVTPGVSIALVWLTAQTLAALLSIILQRRHAQ